MLKKIEVRADRLMLGDQLTVAGREWKIVGLILRDEDLIPAIRMTLRDEYGVIAQDESLWDYHLLVTREVDGP